jgi:alpha-galactosidase
MPQLRPPDRIFFSDSIDQVIPGSKSDTTWRHHGTEVTCLPTPDSLAIDLRAEGPCIRRVQLRWNEPQPAQALYLGDHWERAYGDLAWRTSVPERIMPWYFLAHVKGATKGFGVRTNPGAFCFWTADPAGLSLWLDLRNGTEPTHLGDRTLRAAEIVTVESTDSPYQTARALCAKMCPRPRLPSQPIYGANDWYYAYGVSTAESILRDSSSISALAGSAENRPWSVVDGGWQKMENCNGAPWNISNARFPDMPRLAQKIRDTGCRPGIWMRPLLTGENPSADWLMPDRGPFEFPGLIIDPSVPAVLEKIAADVRGLAAWGYELIKHDFSTYDLFRKWGFQMGADLTTGPWQFRDPTRTNAEIVSQLYRTIREAAGQVLLIGCNTIGHFAAGNFEIQRTGDDTSGKDWERTRRMGVNTLAFRMPQHGTFFAADADCVGLTNAIPWELNCQWLELLAHSGTPLFVSAAPDALGPDQKSALKEAFAIASKPLPPAEPLDWLETTCPKNWLTAHGGKTYDWYAPTGALPFAI